LAILYQSVIQNKNGPTVMKNILIDKMHIATAKIDR